MDENTKQPLCFALSEQTWSWLLHVAQTQTLARPSSEITLTVPADLVLKAVKKQNCQTLTCLI